MLPKDTITLEDVSELLALPCPDISSPISDGWVLRNRVLGLECLFSEELARTQMPIFKLQ